MIDREKVIKALENCTSIPQCRDCPWDQCEEEHEIITMPKLLVVEALELLKSQEPRVMTLEEIDGIPEHRKEYFVEFNYYQEYMDDNGYCRVSANSNGIMVTIWMAKHVLTEDMRDYGKTWRCWSARPTTEQREAAKWDAQT